MIPPRPPALAVLVLAIGTAGGTVAAEPAPPPRPKAGAGIGRFTVGKDTTFVTGPLAPDGRIDYAAALNARLGRGITPDRNAAVPVWRAIGPEQNGKAVPPELFRLIGMDPPPADGTYFEDFHHFALKRLKLTVAQMNDQYDRQVAAGQRPWTADRNPELAAWLKANEGPLALVAEGVRRPDYFSPLVPRPDDTGPGMLIGAFLTDVTAARGMANALTTRAMLRAAEGNADAARADLTAAFRLGRLVGRRGALINNLFGFAVEATAARAAVGLIDAGTLNAAGLAALAADLENLPHPADVADTVALTERFYFLDSLMHLDAQEAAAETGLKDVLRSFLKLPKPQLDWDTTLRAANRYYDGMAAAIRQPTRADRVRELAAVEADLKAMRSKDPADAVRAAIAAGRDPGAAVGESVGQTLLAMMMPAVSKVQDASDRRRQTFDNLRVAVALARFKVDHGRYPKELAELSPKYLARVPADVFNGQPLTYRPEPNGYLLSSVGVDGKDDGGRGPTDEPKGDDLSVRLPAQAAK